MTPVPAARLWSPEQLANYLGVPLKTVYVWSSRGIGPASIRVGRHLRYKPESVAAWLDSQPSGGPREAA